MIPNKTLHEDLGIQSTTNSINKTFQKLYNKLDIRNQEEFLKYVPRTRLEYHFNHPNEMIY